MVRDINDTIKQIVIPLPDTPLGSLNSYVFCGGRAGRSLLIDSGFHTKACFDALRAGMEALRLDPARTDVFFTHVHPDHTGNAAELAAMGCRLFMGRIDAALRTFPGKAAHWARLRAEGLPDDVREAVAHPEQDAFHEPGDYDPVPVEAGQVLHYGGYDLEAVLTPGHSPGHLCLLDRARRTMILGDHVLFSISPNINFWPDLQDALGAYLESLWKVSKFDVTLPLPAHRDTGGKTLDERIGELLRHHQRRLAELEELICDEPGLCARELAAHMRWRVRGGGDWNDFPPAQKCFSLGETISHLDYLLARGRIARAVGADGVAVYRAV
jgi:glyoxylase-like metal-dependent hydrolase (beta-lactamase superfamily II)